MNSPDALGDGKHVLGLDERVRLAVVDEQRAQTRHLLERLAELVQLSENAINTRAGTSADALTYSRSMGTLPSSLSWGNASPIRRSVLGETSSSPKSTVNARTGPVLPRHSRAISATSASCSEAVVTCSAQRQHEESRLQTLLACASRIRGRARVAALQRSAIA